VSPTEFLAKNIAPMPIFLAQKLGFSKLIDKANAGTKLHQSLGEKL
jgi:hypothetical protein